MSAYATHFQMRICETSPNICNRIWNNLICAIPAIEKNFIRKILYEISLIEII